MKKERKDLFCTLGLHEWNYGTFVSPVFGRHERHCLCCDKKQYAGYSNKKRKWITFE